jgi:hypothetical protein
MLETDETIVTALRIVGFLFLFVGVYPSMILTPIFIVSSIVNHTPFLYLPFLGTLSVFYVISALGYFFVVKARNLEKRGATN